MFLTDPLNELTVTALSGPSALTATGNGTGVDVSGFVGRVIIRQNIGTTSGTSPTLDGKIQDSADNSTFADVTGATFTQATAAGVQSIAVDSRLLRKYARYVRTIGGTSPSFTTAVDIIGSTAVF